MFSARGQARLCSWLLWCKSRARTCLPARFLTGWLAGWLARSLASAMLAGCRASVLGVWLHALGCHHTLSDADTVLFVVQAGERTRTAEEEEAAQQLHAEQVQPCCRHRNL